MLSALLSSSLLLLLLLLASLLPCASASLLQSREGMRSRAPLFAPSLTLGSGPTKIDVSATLTQLLLKVTYLEATVAAQQKEIERIDLIQQQCCAPSWTLTVTDSAGLMLAGDMHLSSWNLTADHATITVPVMSSYVPGAQDAAAKTEWVKGHEPKLRTYPDTLGAQRVKGQKGVPHDDNTPGTRDGSIYWQHPDGDLYLYGQSRHAYAFFYAAGVYM